MPFSPKHKGALSCQAITMWSKDTLLHAGARQGLSYALVVPLLLVISETKELSNTLVWATLKVGEHKMQWDTALARALRYGCHTAQHVKSYSRFPVFRVSFIRTSHFKPKEGGL